MAFNRKKEAKSLEGKSERRKSFQKSDRAFKPKRNEEGGTSSRYKKNTEKSSNRDDRRRSEKPNNFIKKSDKKYADRGDREKKYADRGDREKKYSGKSSSYKKTDFKDFSDRSERPKRSKPFNKFEKDKREFKSDKFNSGERPFNKFRKDKSDSLKREPNHYFDKHSSTKFKKKEDAWNKFKNEENTEYSDTRNTYNSNEDREGGKYSKKRATGFKRQRNDFSKKSNEPQSDLIRLNKYLSNAGVSSRREADVLIASGAVKVNGEVVTEMGYKISLNDRVTFGDDNVRTERKKYLLLNKPKDYITTVDDPRERRTVMKLIEGACKERVYPVGRLDRNTTGLLLFTNDGELTKKLTHPKFNVGKVYQVTLNRGLKQEDFDAINNGIELEDGLIKADEIAYVGEGKKEIGIEIHSGKNRIVRRMFEHLGYEVIKLDRVLFAGLTKKDLPRGRWRFLTDKEIAFLKMK
ncbi:MAG: rRNA pseudouridine synthase [Bacteroidetes bacterium]|nr:rRNA pseudouridine synthase [Bacteroidota bacterium]